MQRHLSDGEADLDLLVWAGVLPLAQLAGAPIADPQLGAGVELPDYLADFARERN